MDFCGFAPGFGYLSGLPEPLRQPRLESARSAVPAGSVGVADVYSCVYPAPLPRRVAADRPDRPRHVRPGGRPAGPPGPR